MGVPSPKLTLILFCEPMFLQDDRLFARAAELAHGVTSGMLEHMNSSYSSSALRSATAVALGVSVAAVAVLIVAYATGNAGYLFPGSDRARFRARWRPWRKRYPPLSLRQWREAFDHVNGRLVDGGDKVIDIVQRGGVEQNIRAEVWPFVLGVHDLSSTRDAREEQTQKKREEFLELRRLCTLAQQCLVDQASCSDAASVQPESSSQGEFHSEVSSTAESDDPELHRDEVPGAVEELDVNIRQSSVEGKSEDTANVVDSGNVHGTSDEKSLAKNLQVLGDHDPKWVINTSRALEDFGTWQRIIRLDAIRMNADWLPFSSSAASVTEEAAEKLAEQVGLKDTEHLDAARKHFGARLVGILEAYTILDSETGYCQGMSDLLAPFAAIIDDDCEAFWCFSSFMRAARHNFRLDETGIQRQLDLVSRILKAGDPELYEHLVRIRSEDCTFVYRMILVFLRRELTFEQSLCLWEVIWADWALIRRRNKEANAGSNSRTPASSDLLLYTIAAAVRNKKDHILEYCRGMDDMLRECNDMAGHLDVWVLLDDARELVGSIRGTVK